IFAIDVKQFRFFVNCQILEIKHCNKIRFPSKLQILFKSEKQNENEEKNQSSEHRSRFVSHSGFVPRAGIEPALPKEQDFESSASTSSATEASRLFRRPSVLG